MVTFSCCPGSSQNRARIPRQIDSRWSWFVCLAASLSNGLVNAVIYSFGVMLPVLFEFKESRKRTALVGSLAIAVSCFAGILGGRLSDNLGCQRTLVIGSLTCALSLLVSSWATGTLFLYFSYGILFGLGASSIYMPCFLIVCKYFKKRRALAVGIVSAGSGVGVFVMGPLLQAMIEFLGWRNAYRILAGVFLVSCLGAYSFDSNIEKKNTGDNLEEERLSERETSDEVRVIAKKKIMDFSVLRIPSFTVFLISMTLVSFGHFSPSIHLVGYCKELGFSGQEASYLYLCIGISSLMARLVVGRICDLSWVNPLRIAQASYFCSALVTFLLTVRLGYVFLAVLSLFYGLADGTFWITFNILCLTTVRPEQRSHALGFARVGVALTVAGGPPITGLIADRLSYVKAFYISGAVTLLAASIPFVLMCIKNKNVHHHVRSKLNGLDEEGRDEAPTEWKKEFVTSV